MFAFKKLAERLLSPVGLTLILLMLIALQKQNKSYRSRVLAVLALIAMLPPSLPIVADQLIGQLERFSPPTALESAQRASAIVVLGGTVLPQSGQGLLAEEVAGSRLLAAFRLYQAKKAPKILVSSGISYETESGIRRTEAEDMRDILLEMGIPAADIFLENESMDTGENATLSATKLLPAEPDILLVTSAYHLKRASKQFRKAGFHVQPIGSGYSLRPAKSGFQRFLPSSTALNRSSQAIKEYWGLLAFSVFP